MPKKERLFCDSMELHDQHLPKAKQASTAKIVEGHCVCSSIQGRFPEPLERKRMFRECKDGDLLKAA